MSSLPYPSVPRRLANTTDAPRPRSATSRRYIPLLQRVAGLNVVLLLAVVAVTVLVLAPSRVSSLAIDAELLVVLAAVGVVVTANVCLLRRLIGPVQALTALARHVDPTSPARMPGAEPTSEAGELAMTFNEMLSRLEVERREATGRVLAAQEAERLRIAQELHDQVGQELTAVLLGLARVQSHAPKQLAKDLLTVQDAVRASLEDVRRIAIELRPEALEDLGLTGALAVLAQRFSERLGLEMTLEIPAELPALSAETELVIYRVVQEAVTNVARHSGVRAATLAVACLDGRLTVTVRDDGRGLAPGQPAGTGMRGMRERATLIGARLDIGNLGTGSGCEVRLAVPIEASR